ncbi:MAG: hypothetical protein ACP5MB_11405 [bacterium]
MSEDIFRTLRAYNGMKVIVKTSHYGSYRGVLEIEEGIDGELYVYVRYGDRKEQRIAIKPYSIVVIQPVEEGIEQ